MDIVFGFEQFALANWKLTEGSLVQIVVVPVLRTGQARCSCRIQLSSYQYFLLLRVPTGSESARVPSSSLIGGWLRTVLDLHWLAD